MLKLEVEELGGATKFQCRSELTEKFHLQSKLFRSFARKRNEKSMSQKLAAEILAAEKEESCS